LPAASFASHSAAAAKPGEPSRGAPVWPSCWNASFAVPPSCAIALSLSGCRS
jgi:hypothetical protein